MVIMMNVEKNFGFSKQFFNFLWYWQICITHFKNLFVAAGNEKGIFYIIDLKLIFPVYKLIVLILNIPGFY